MPKINTLPKSILNKINTLPKNQNMYPKNPISPSIQWPFWGSNTPHIGGSLGNPRVQQKHQPDLVHLRLDPAQSPQSPNLFVKKIRSNSWPVTCDLWNTLNLLVDLNWKWTNEPFTSVYTMEFLIT